MFDSAVNIIILIIVAIVLFAGSTKIPEIFRALGRAKGEFKKGELEAEAELQKMKEQVSGQQQAKEDKAAQLEKQIAELQKQLEELKKQKDES